MNSEPKPETKLEDFITAQKELDQLLGRTPREYCGQTEKEKDDV